MPREAPALAACKPHLIRLSVGFLGIIGDTNHSYGYHLSRSKLIATGNRGDYSLTGSRNSGGPNDVCCAIDVRVTPHSSMPAVKRWTAAPKFLEWLRAERKAGRVTEVSELIGSLNGRTAVYAADSTGWAWKPYQGTGHVDWIHVAVYRSSSASTSFADRTFGRWSRTGLIPPKEPPMPYDQFKPWYSRWGKNVQSLIYWFTTVRPREQAAEKTQAAELADLRADHEALVARVAALEPPASGGTQ